jgi:DNA ligase D-like protein (predicted 3'-phosphoesterase)
VARDDPLAEYQAKRDLAASGEPEDGEPGERPRFVVQRHEATTVHYDFRLEVDGVLKSWAVPKGPSLNPREKRLAIRTEDHPLDYAEFEGRIPEGHYGAGTVIVWDLGTYRNLTERRGKPVPIGRAIAEGHLKVWLAGHKLTGAFALTRTDLPGSGEQWLLVKVADEFADPDNDPTVTQPASVLSGRTNKDLERE